MKVSPVQLFYWSSRKSFFFFKFRHRVQTAAADRDPGQEPHGSHVSSPQITINQIWRNVVSWERYKSTASLQCRFWTWAHLREKLARRYLCVMNESATSLGVCVFKALAGFPASLCYRWNNTPEVLPPQCWQKRLTNSGLQGLVFLHNTALCDSTKSSSFHMSSFNFCEVLSSEMEMRV